jgi:hypothetical protein
VRGRLLRPIARLAVAPRTARRDGRDPTVPGHAARLDSARVPGGPLGMPGPSGPCGPSLRPAIADGLGAKSPRRARPQPLGDHRADGDCQGRLGRDGAHGCRRASEGAAIDVFRAGGSSFSADHPPLRLLKQFRDATNGSRFLFGSAGIERRCFDAHLCGRRRVCAARRAGDEDD